MEEKKYFPIKIDPACQLKWSYSSIYMTTANTCSCHRVTKHVFDVDSFDFHNTEEKLAQRTKMLDGQWPGDGCEYCKNIEDTNSGQSDRQFQLQIPNLYPPELDLNRHEINVSPTILEIFFDNVCNMSCVYCCDSLSSKIDFENKKFGKFDQKGVVIDDSFKKHNDYEKILSKFWQWMDANAKNLKRFIFLGGEPLYQKQSDQLLEFFDKNPCPDLECSVFTNLMVQPQRLQQFIEKVKQLIKDKKLKRFEVTASIDCWGPQAEYVRYGLDLDRWKENFEYLISEKWLTLNINGAISILTIKTMPELIELLNRWQTNRKIGFFFQKVVEPSYMNPDILGADEFKKDIVKILDLMETESWMGAQAKNYIQGIFATIEQAEVNQPEAEKLIIYLDEIDRRRRTNWHNLFPWLEKYTHVV